VLFVDDDDDVRSLVATALDEAGYRLVHARNAYVALNAIEDERPDLIITSPYLAGLTGFELVRRLQDSPATSQIPVLFIANPSVESEGIDYGLAIAADEYLTMPFAPATLVARVELRLAAVNAVGRLVRSRANVLTRDEFAAAAGRESARALRSGGDEGVVVVVEVAEQASLVAKFGSSVMHDVWDELASLATAEATQSELIGVDPVGRLLVLMPHTGAADAYQRVSALTARVARRTFVSRGERVHITPASGLAVFGDAPVTGPELVRRARLAALVARNPLDLRPVVWQASFHEEPAAKRPLIPRGWRTYLQFLATLVLGIVVPFGVYAGADAVGINLVGIAYYLVVIALILTGVMIWTEGFFALRPIQMPENVSRPFPPASAIIAAYLPNEAATVEDTLEAFLRIGYPGPLQVILAYNTPHDLPVEESLRALAAREPRIELLRVEGSTSKAQNVNAALSSVTGEFVGVFDADHHPARNAYVRAWHWLCDDYDVVQGHCVVRNGDASWVARAVAVEFESIYAVSHPGRARLHAFAIFGGSNGYWRTSLLRGIRMRGSMLTEDIDSSIRLLQAGGRLASDPLLYSRELAPTTVTALWYQRMRWAQGWFQVSLRHLVRGLGSRELSVRQKLGLWALLGWREAYPWVAIQMIPIVAYLAYTSGGVDQLDWLVPLFVFTTLFTFSVGPGQTLFAWILAAPEIKAHRSWFWSYLAVASLLYTEFKNTINRVSQLKEWSRERQWKVTPRETPDAGD
jgi:cellulose synthase/poly-beta-1,6-N-acetylglucosamine synthase-like glycosyltransferase/DNA-binding NarL/FixJ family response regulator